MKSESWVGGREQWMVGLLFAIALLPAGAAHALKVTVAEKITLEADGWWQQIPSPYQNTKELVGGRERDGRTQARASLMVLRHSSADAALARLTREAAIAVDAEAQTISGHPAVRAREEIEMEQ